MSRLPLLGLAPAVRGAVLAAGPAVAEGEQVAGFPNQAERVL